MTVTIRAAGLEEASTFAALHRQHFVPAWDAAAFEDLIAYNGAVALLAVSQEEPVGFILGRVIADEAEILTLGVKSDWQRRRVATRLVNELAARAAERGASRIFLEVAAENQGALQLYRALGFDETGRRPGYYERRDEPPVDAIIMARSAIP